MGKKLNFVVRKKNRETIKLQTELQCCCCRRLIHSSFSIDTITRYDDVFHS